jgi:signal transduction histidine kinase
VQLAQSADGVSFSAQDLGGAASFYSSATPLARQDLHKVARLASLDPLMKELVARSPLIESLYFNSWDSYNHIYPWFLTPEQYPPAMVIPDYNFYYLADAAHNPTRELVWTNVYLDPAGHGWMMSAIAPVYRGTFLEGVSGVDITVGGILKQIRGLQVPADGYAMLVSNQLNIMAMPALGEVDFGLGELTTHAYDEAVQREMFKPQDFILGQRAETQALAAAITAQAQGVHRLDLNGRPHLVAWATIAATGWHLLVVVDEADVFSQTNALASRYEQIGYLLIAGLVLFYLVFFALLWWRALQLSKRLRAPIAGIARMMGEIGRGQWRPQRVDAQIRELDEMAGHALAMGEQLEHSETDLRQAILDAQMASKAKSRFISSVSHEFRTPLNAIHGFAQLMQMERPSEGQAEGPDYLDEILIASEHLNQLVGDILDWSSLQVEKPQLQLQAVEVASLMSECADLVRLQAHTRGLQFSLEPPAPTLQVWAEPRRLRQVLLNLLSNALKYNRPAGQITLGYQLLDGHVRLQVEDSGLGISAALQDQVFEPFQRVGQENTAIQGNGLGLALCQEFAELMHGRMGLQSTLGAGSCFWIELSLLDAEGLAPAAND